MTFSTAGTGQTWVVPAGVTSESLTLYGAIGGSGEDTVGTATFLGGDGAKVTGTLSAGPGTTLTVDVGGAGSNLGRPLSAVSPAQPARAPVSEDPAAKEIGRAHV